MVTLEEYKDYIINYYRYEIDNSVEKKKQRKVELTQLYGDSFLQRIIDDTYDFLPDLLASETINSGYCEFEIVSDKTKGIFLNISGSFDADTIYFDAKGRMISKYILQSILGNRLEIEIEESNIESEDDDIIGIDYRFYLYIQGFPDNLEQIKKEILGQTRKKLKCSEKGD